MQGLLLLSFVSVPAARTLLCAGHRVSSLLLGQNSDFFIFFPLQDVRLGKQCYSSCQPQGQVKQEDKCHSTGILYVFQAGIKTERL